MIFTGASTNKAYKIFKQLSVDGIDVSSPSQSAVYRATFKEATYETKLAVKNLSLYYDKKHIEENEYRVVVLEKKNEKTKVKLDGLHLKDDKADTITQAIAKVIDE